LYLARAVIHGRTHFLIRQSVLFDGTWESRDLFALGPDPARWIHRPGGNAYYIDETVEDALRDKGVEASQEDLEQVFWPFLPPEVREVIRPFHARTRDGARQRYSRAELSSVQAGVHPFDKRRLYFLRYGPGDPGKVAASALRLFNRVLEKSRDEIEQGLEAQEAGLHRHERKAYVHFSFHLERFFPGPLAGRWPRALEGEELDRAFLREVCTLQADRTLFPAGGDEPALDPVLVRYVIFFFDHDFEAPSWEQAYARDFMNRHRAHRPPQRRRERLPLEKACEILGISPRGFSSLSRRGVTQQYRQMALAYHPDRGGSHERFIRLTQAYRELLDRVGNDLDP